MATEAQLAYLREYKKAKLRRVPLDLSKAYYEEVVRAAEIAGESVNGYIKNAIRMRMEKEEQA